MTPQPFRNPDKRFDAGKWMMLGAMFVLSVLLFLRLLQHPTSDIGIHTEWAGEGDFRDLSTFLRHGAHPLWHCIVVFVTLFGVPLKTASAVVTALCKVAEVWLIHRMFTIALHDKYSRSAITLFSAVCALVSCVCVPFYNPTVYLGAGTPNTWHSCTQLIALVFMLICVPYTAYLFDRFVELESIHREKTILPWREPITLGVLLFLSLLAKPTFMQAFLPGACLFFLVQWIRYPKNSRYFLQIIVCVLPSVVFMIIQYLYYFGIIVPWQASMVMEFSLAKFADVAIRVALMLAFPIYTLWSARKQEKDTCFWLTLVFNAVAIAEFLILGESGRRAKDGNFGWGMMGAALMMWVTALIRFLRDENVRRRWLGWTLLGWHLISGLYYIGYLFVTGAFL